MGCQNDPSIEQMKFDLHAAGWERKAGNIYMTPWGTYYRGPHKAWHIWHGGTGEWMAILDREGKGGVDG